VRGFVKVPTSNEAVENTTGEPAEAFDVIINKDLERWRFRIPRKPRR
jgi:hypothetical protein